MTATLCKPIVKKPAPRMGKKDWVARRQWWGNGSKTIPVIQTKPSTPIDMEILKKKTPA